jgi:hypothetical protein
MRPEPVELRPEPVELRPEPFDKLRTAPVEGCIPAALRQAQRAWRQS